MSRRPWCSGIAFGLIALLSAGGVLAAEKAAPMAPGGDKWLQEVGPLLTDAERDVYLSLTRDYQRRAFVERFWQSRDPFPETSRNELRENWEERVTEARSRFQDLDNDRARLFLLVGPPAEVKTVRCSGVLRPLEIWRYASSPALRREIYVVFADVGGEGEGRFREWSPRDGLWPLLLAPDAATLSDPEILDKIAKECFRGDDVASALVDSADPAALRAALAPKKPASEEWLRTFSARSTDLPEGAETFPAELRVSFPGHHQSRTVVQALVTVPQGGVVAGTASKFPSYDFVVDGEVLRRDDLFESFRYRYHFPAGEVADGRIPLVFQRYLRPGSYRLILKVEDLASGRFFHREEALDVPTTKPRRTPPEEMVAEASAPADPLAEANADLAGGDASIRLLPPPPGLLVGNTRVEAATTGSGIARVRFYLDGRLVLTKGRAPYSVELDVGEAPRLHRVEAVAMGEDDRELARDEVMLNAGPHRFAVRLVEPRRGGRYRASLKARAEVEVPEGETLDRVEFFLNDTPVATLYQPPFIQPIVIPRGLDLAYVRAQAFLKDGNSSEDVVFVNAPDYVDEMDVQFVELYTTVVNRRGRPVEGLTAADFKVTEDGTAQTLRRVERVTDTPIYAGVLLDTSASMFDEIGEAKKAAYRFFETVLTPKDRAAVITFSDEPHLAVRFTNNPQVLAGGLADVVAEGETALYDSLIYSLYYFSGIQGKRAIILISDGKDEGSRYRFEDALEYARRTGVAIYTIGLGQAGLDREVQVKLGRLANETGGRWFAIDRASELGSVYQKIETELRSQYLLTYQSSVSKKDGKFRTVEVAVDRPGLEAKTIRGYYP